MADMNILQYFNANASKEEWEVVQKLYSRELAIDLKELGMQGKESFNLAELAVIYTRNSLCRDLEHIATIDNELGGANNESAKDLYMDIIKETLEDYEEEENNG